MPAQIYWLETPHHIMAVDYTGRVTIDDVRYVIQGCVIELAHQPIHFLVDFSLSESFDRQIIELSSLSEWLYHPNARWFAYVRLTGLYKNLLQLRHPNSLRFFQERAEAEAFLRQVVAQTAPGD